MIVELQYISGQANVNSSTFPIQISAKQRKLLLGIIEA